MESVGLGHLKWPSSAHDSCGRDPRRGRTGAPTTAILTPARGICRIEAQAPEWFLLRGFIDVITP
jgi:hypothetical protein